MTRALDDALFELAVAQDGVVSTAQARRLGFTRHQIEHRRSTGRWVGARPGVLRAAGTPVTWESDLLAAWLVVADRAVVSRTSAAVLHGLSSDRHPPEFTAPRGRSASIRGAIVHATRRLDAIDVVTVRRHVPAAVRRSRVLRAAGLVTAFRATSASRTIIDLAHQLAPDALAEHIDRAAGAGLISTAFLQRRLDDLRSSGRSGVTRLDAVMVDSGGHSYLERRFLGAIRRAGLARPRCQVTRSIDGRFVARVDFSFDPFPLVVEVNGRRGHSSDGDRAKDARRRNELQSLGLVVLEFTYAQVVEHPDDTVSTVAAALARTRLASKLPPGDRNSGARADHRTASEGEGRARRATNR